jgi:NADH-quinone oxidoreductase subunit C
MTLPDERNPEGHVPQEAIENEPPPTPEEAPAEQAQAEGKPTDEGAPSPPADTAAGGPGKKSDQPSPPVEGTKEAEEKLAAQAPAAEKPAEKPERPEKPAAEKPERPEKPAGERPARPERPARAAEPKEAPREAPPPGSINEVLAAAVPGVEMQAYMVPSMTGEDVAVEVPRESLRDVITAARDHEALDLRYLRSLSGVDWQDEGLEVVYHLYSFSKNHNLTVKTRAPLDDPRIPSLCDVIPAANWHERETRDMFGIEFEGHQNLVPLLLPEDMTDHFPLRKENPLQEIEEWQGEFLREGDGDGEESE